MIGKVGGDYTASQGNFYRQGAQTELKKAEEIKVDGKKSIDASQVDSIT